MHSKATKERVERACWQKTTNFIYITTDTAEVWAYVGRVCVCVCVAGAAKVMLAI